MAVHVADIPEQKDMTTIYLVGDTADAWWAVFLCPCGCTATIELSLISDDKPSWSVTEHENGTVTLYPSIARTRGCKAHFFVRRGNVDWATPASG